MFPSGMSIRTAQLLPFGSGSSAQPGLSLIAQFNLALDDGELHTCLPHHSIQLQYGLVLDLGHGKMCMPVATTSSIVFPPTLSTSSNAIALCPDRNLKRATGWWDGQALSTACRFLWGFPPGKI